MDAVESPKFGKEFPVKIARALISMMARSSNALQAEAGYIDARPLTTSLSNLLATHGRTIHRVTSSPDQRCLSLLISRTRLEDNGRSRTLGHFLPS